MEEGIFPSYMSISADNPEPEIEEERRLCYVGITRAMKELYMSAAAKRMLRGENQYNSLSRFIKEIPRYLLNVTSPSGHGTSYRNSDAFPESKIRSAKSTFSAPAYGTPGQNPRPAYSSTMFDKAPAKNIGSGTAKPLPYGVGDTVLHIKFGTGTVTSIVNGGKDYEVTVEFPHYGPKKLLSSFANLKKL
jgi:DNA helicase-2/ATP-dependent DNA helicase PcrA